MDSICSAVVSNGHGRRCLDKPFVRTTLHGRHEHFFCRHHWIRLKRVTPHDDMEYLGKAPSFTEPEFNPYDDFIDAEGLMFGNPREDPFVLCHGTIHDLDGYRGSCRQRSMVQVVLRSGEIAYYCPHHFYSIKKSIIPEQTEYLRDWGYRDGRGVTRNTAALLARLRQTGMINPFDDEEKNNVYRCDGTDSLAWDEEINQCSDVAIVRITSDQKGASVYYCPMHWGATRNGNRLSPRDLVEHLDIEAEMTRCLSSCCGYGRVPS